MSDKHESRENLSQNKRRAYSPHQTVIVASPTVAIKVLLGTRTAVLFGKGHEFAACALGEVRVGVVRDEVVEVEIVGGLFELVVGKGVGDVVWKGGRDALCCHSGPLCGCGLNLVYHQMLPTFQVGIGVRVGIGMGMEIVAGLEKVDEFLRDGFLGKGNGAPLCLRAYGCEVGECRIESVQDKVEVALVRMCDAELGKRLCSTRGGLCGADASKSIRCVCDHAGRWSRLTSLACSRCYSMVSLVPTVRLEWRVASRVCRDPGPYVAFCACLLLRLEFGQREAARRSRHKDFDRRCLCSAPNYMDRCNHRPSPWMLSEWVRDR